MLNLSFALQIYCCSFRSSFHEKRQNLGLDGDILMGPLSELWAVHYKLCRVNISMCTLFETFIGKFYSEKRFQGAMQNLWVIWGRCKCGTGQGLFLHMHRKNGGGAFFKKHIHGANTFFIHFYVLLFTLGTISADNKEKPMAGCKNQLIKKYLRNF